MYKERFILFAERQTFKANEMEHIAWLYVRKWRLMQVLIYFGGLFVWIILANGYVVAANAYIADLIPIKIEHKDV